MNCHENERNSEETTTHNVTFNIRIFRLIDLRRVAYASNIPSNYSLLLSSQLLAAHLYYVKFNKRRGSTFYPSNCRQHFPV